MSAIRRRDRGTRGQGDKVTPSPCPPLSPSPRRSLSLFVVLVMVVLAVVPFSVTLAQSPQTPLLPPWAVLQTPPPPTVPPGDGPWVVRAFYSDRQMVDDLARWTEPWEVHHDQGYLVVEVDRAGYERLLAAGFVVAVDEELTAQLNRLNTYLPGQVTGIPGYTCYRTVEETYATAQQIVASYPNLASWIDIGNSWEKQTPGGNPGYDIRVLRLTNAAIPGPKPALFVMSAIHAREYTPAELNTRFAEYLVQNYGLDPDVTWILDYHEIHLLLQSNPDGRKKAETGLYWRKNTNESYCGPTSNYRGADLNRNFPFQWGCCGGGSNDPCDETYRGPYALSEPETQAVRGYVRSIFPDQRPPDLNVAAPVTATGVFIDLHSYSELVLWPWGFTGTPAPNGTALQTLGRKFAYFNGYWPEQSYSLYPTDGTTDDFAYGDLGVAAYTFELGTQFFQSCTVFENTILPANLPALLYAAKVVRTPYMTPAGPDALNVSATPATVEVGQPFTLTATLNDTRYNNQNGAEPVQAIAAAEYYIDTPPWVTATVAYAMAATDGAFNSSIEGVRAVVDTAGLTPGRHIVFVRGRDAAGNWGPFSAVFVDLLLVAPTAAFTHTSPVVVGMPVSFTNQSSGTSPLEYVWDFGDGIGTSTETHPVYVYASDGVFTVTLTATNAGGSDSFSRAVTVSFPAPTAAFTHTSPVVVGMPVSFTNQSSGMSPLEYVWDFGDGIGTSTETHPVYVYASDGVFTVTLTATNAGGSDSFSRAVEVWPRRFYLPLVLREF